MNAFTIASYKKLARGDSNLILSPFNIATAFSMALAGARGQAAEEIQAVLHLHYESTCDAALGGHLCGPHQGWQQRRQRTSHRQRTLGAKRIGHPAGFREDASQQLPRATRAARFHVPCGRLCGIDLGKQSRLALRWAGLFANDFCARLTIVHAIPAAKDHPDVYCDQDWKVELVRGAKEKIQALQRSLALEASIAVHPGRGAFRGEHHRAAHNADLLVIGRSIENGMLGRLRTNAYSIIRQSLCPVVSL